MSPARAQVTRIVAEGSLRHAAGRLVVETSGPRFYDISAPIGRFVSDEEFGHGLANIFCRHTSASLVIQENADPDVQRDLAAALDRLAPRSAAYVHDAEGPDDMPAHIRTMLTGTSVAVPIVAGSLALGTWQGIYLAEHRDAPHRREIVINLIGT